MNNICLDCGNDYVYTPGRALGASSTRCARCRKRDTKRNKYIDLLLIAGHGVMQCRKCGYRSCSHALILKDAVATLDSLSPKDKAKRQFILCLNCNAQLESNEIEFKVTDSKVYPVEVEFYSREVVVMRNKITPAVEYHNEYEQPEIVSEDSGRETKGVSAKAQRSLPEPTIEV